MFEVDLSFEVLWC